MPIASRAVAPAITNSTRRRTPITGPSRQQRASSARTPYRPGRWRFKESPIRLTFAGWRGSPVHVDQRLRARDPVRFHPPREVVGRHRPGVVEALRDVTAQILQSGHVPGPFYPFRTNGQPEVGPEVDGAPDEYRVVVVAGHVEDERPIDLQLVDRQPLEVGHGRISGTEVVDGQPDTEVAQVGQRG